MFRALVGAKFFEHLSAEAVLRKHALDGFVNKSVALFSDHVSVRSLLQTADITGVIGVKLLFGFFAGQSDLIAIDDNNVISAIDVRRESRFVFTS